MNISKNVLIIHRALQDRFQQRVHLSELDEGVRLSREDNGKVLIQ